jgi:hypothetical protein
VDAGGAGDETDAESGEAEAALQESGRRDGENTGELGMATVQDMARGGLQRRDAVFGVAPPPLSVLLCLFP